MRLISIGRRQRLEYVGMNWSKGRLCCKWNWGSPGRSDFAANHSQDSETLIFSATSRYCIWTMARQWMNVGRKQSVTYHQRSPWRSSGYVSLMISSMSANIQRFLDSSPKPCRHDRNPSLLYSISRINSNLRSSSIWNPRKQIHAMITRDFNWSIKLAKAIYSSLAQPCTLFACSTHLCKEQ